MAAQSRLIELGSSAPDFELPDPAGRTYRLADFAGAKALLVAFQYQNRAHDFSDPAA